MTEAELEAIARRGHDEESEERELTRAERHRLAIAMAENVLDNLLVYLEAPEEEPFNACFTVDGSLHGPIHKEAQELFESELHFIAAACSVAQAARENKELPETFQFAPLGAEFQEVLRTETIVLSGKAIFEEGSQQHNTAIYQATRL